MGICDEFARVDADPWLVLVLGGGGVKGNAHVGALKALAEASVRPAGIVGTSIGALVGAPTSTAAPHTLSPFTGQPTRAPGG
jgi:predicted acylesterase/phospholipase RssA